MQSNQCYSCEHHWSSDRCAAFPDGIPDEIFTGMFDHKHPYPNAKKPTDNGIRFLHILREIKPIDGD